MSDTAAMVAFLRARLDEDEARANGLLFACLIPGKLPDFSSCGGPAAEVYWQHFTAGRVLREVEAGRKLLARRQEVGSRERGWDGTECDNDLAELLDGLIRDRIAVYSDHPDYRQEWKP